MSEKSDEDVFEDLQRFLAMHPEVLSARALDKLEECAGDNPEAISDERLEKIRRNVRAAVASERESNTGEVSIRRTGHMQPWVKSALAVAASLLIGLFAGHYLWPSSGMRFSGSDLQLAAVDTTLRGAEKGKAIQIESPVNGFATLVLVRPSGLDSLPRAGGAECRVSPGEEASIEFGLGDFSAAYVFITQTGGAHEIVRRFLFQNQQLPDVAEAITAELRDKGHDWVLVNSVEF